MTISIITVCFNSAKTVSKSIESVLDQTYNKLEYIIIDGGSTDGTLEIINKYKDKIAVVVSEPDAGIYDAMNKGIKLATGDVIGILNSDDVYCNNHVLAKVADSFAKTNTDSVYGDIVLSKPDNMNKPVRKWIAKNRSSFIWGWHPPHTGLFLKKRCYQSFGLYKIKYNVSADFELMLRFFHLHKIKSFYLQETIVNMRIGGASTGSFKNIMEGNLNIQKAFKENKVRYIWAYPFIRAIKKLIQYF